MFDVGESSRPIRIRFKEHFSNARLVETDIHEMVVLFWNSCETIVGAGALIPNGNRYNYFLHLYRQIENMLSGTQHDTVILPLGSHVLSESKQSEAAFAVECTGALNPSILDASMQQLCCVS